MRNDLMFRNNWWRDLPVGKSFYIERGLSMNEITMQDFLTELRKELDYLTEGGTSYRKVTCQLAISIAEKIEKEDGDVILFLNVDKTKEIVYKCLNEYKEERKVDTVKMLNTIEKSLYYQSNLPLEVKKYLQLKNRIRVKPLLKKKSEQGDVGED